MTQEDQRTGLNQPVGKSDLRTAFVVVGVLLLGVVAWTLFGGLLKGRSSVADSEVPASLQAMAAAPSASTLDWTENGLSVFRLGDTAYAQETVLSRWSATDWWVDLRSPKISKEALGSISSSGGNELADTYTITSGPLQGARLVAAKSGNRISVWSAEYVSKRP